MPGWRLEGHGPLTGLDVLENRLNIFVGQLAHIFKDEHQATNLIDQLGFIARQAIEDVSLCRAIADVEHLGYGRHTTGFLERLTHEHAHALRQRHFDFFDRFGAGLAHFRDALNNS